MNRKDILDNYYSNTDEDSRLIKDKRHNVEFFITKEYINKYLKKGMKILEVGAGTGRYSLYYASLGYDVTSVEYVKHNLDILKSKITIDMQINPVLGDAINLSQFSDDTFDMTLVLGPLYHLYEDSDIKKAISEAIRVTKKDGVIMIAFITSDGVFADWGINHLLDGKPNDFDENFKLIRYPEGVFAPFYIEEFENIMKEYPVTFLHEVATDGIAKILAEKINNFTKEEFEVWLKYQLSICERRDLQGFSQHMLYICKKK